MFNHSEGKIISSLSGSLSLFRIRLKREFCFSRCRNGGVAEMVGGLAGGSHFITCHAKIQLQRRVYLLHFFKKFSCVQRFNL